MYDGGEEAERDAQRGELSAPFAARIGRVYPYWLFNLRAYASAQT